MKQHLLIMTGLSLLALTAAYYIITPLLSDKPARVPVSVTQDTLIPQEPSIPPEATDRCVLPDAETVPEPVQEQVEIESALPSTDIKTAEKPRYSYRLGFTGISDQMHSTLAVTGTVPDWLRGDLFLVGPGKFHVGESTARHWLDGLAMIHHISLRGNTVIYRNQFINSHHYDTVYERDSLQLPAPIAGNSFFSKCLSALSSSSQPVYDNTNINIIAPESHCLITCTETPYHISINPKTLHTTERIQYDDRLKGHHTTAHPWYDAEQQTWINVMVHYGRTSTYKLYSTDFATAQRTLLWSKKVSEPSYMHSFASTDRYTILIESPFVINPMDLLYDNKPFIQHFMWKPELGTTFTVIDRHSGQTVAEHSTDPFFYLHTVHAYEQKDGTIVIDLVAYDNPHFMDEQYQLKNIFHRSKQQWPQGTVQRYTIDINRDRITRTKIGSHHCIMPVINRTYVQNRSHRYLYGKRSNQKNNFYNELVKIDLGTKQELTWSEHGCYPGEPIIVSKPGAQSEDDAVIFSVVLDTVHGNSFVLLLDAKSFTEIARATALHHIPFTVHGTFCKS